MARHSDLEAGTKLLTIPIPVAFSSAREPVRIENQPRLRSKCKAKVHSPRTAQASGQAEQFFETLRKDLGNESREDCLFVCWENEIDDQRAIPLLVDDREDEVRVYQDLVKIWYERHGWWWRFIPFHKVQMVEEVKFSFIGKQGNDFSVVIKRLDISGIKARLTSDLEDASANVRKMMHPFEYTFVCEQDESTGMWSHDNNDCLMGNGPLGYACYFETELDSQRKLDRLGLLSLPLRCFHDPEKAAPQRTLTGLAQKSCIYRISEIEGKHYFQERVGEQQFRALMIQAGFSRWRPFNIRALAMTIVMLWKVSGGTWEAAFASGGFLIILVSLSSRIDK